MLPESYFGIPLGGLDAVGGMVGFPLFLGTGEGRYVLYREAQARFDADQVFRLQAEGVDRLYIREVDRGSYFRHIEDKIDVVLRNRALSVAERAESLCGVAVGVARRLLDEEASITEDGVLEMERILGSACSFLLRESQALRAIRGRLEAEPGLGQHSVNVAMLAIGLASRVLGKDPQELRLVGLCGLLHDVGRFGGIGEDDPDHGLRGSEMLRGTGLPSAVVTAVMYHDERYDGSGPVGLSGQGIPILAQIVGIADAFDELYSERAATSGVYGALCALAQQQARLFEPELAVRFIEQFR